MSKQESNSDREKTRSSALAIEDRCSDRELERSPVLRDLALELCTENKKLREENAALQEAVAARDAFLVDLV
jgi:hypothetical protein